MDEGNVKAYSVSDIKKLLGVEEKADCAKITISPKQAQLLLEHTNTNNRRMRHDYTEYYSKIVKNDDWALAPDCISWDAKGVLTNGQHRLTAISKYDKSVSVFVAFGVEASTAIDNGAKRSFTDNVRITDICDERIKDNAMIHNVFITACMLCKDGTSGKKLSLTPDERVELMNEYVDELLECDEAGLFTRLNTKGCNATVIKAVLFLAYVNGVNLELLKHIIDVLKTGITNTKADAPIIGLRDTLCKIIGGGREVSQMRACYTTNCIEKCLKGSKTKKLYMKGCYTLN